MKRKGKRGICDNCGKRRVLHVGFIWMDYGHYDFKAKVCKECADDCR